MRKQLSFTGLLLALFIPATALAAQAQVSLGVNSISPSVVTVNPGDTVVWANTSGTTQSVIGNNNLFQSGSIAPSGQFAATFNTSGTYNYYDNANGSAIVGEVIVNGNSNAVSTTATTQSTYNPNAGYYTSTSANNGASIASLTAQVQALIAQINAMQGTSGNAYAGSSGSTNVGTCPQIGRVLSMGDTGNDVASLQQFLHISPATGYFGSLTQTAVEQWQAANNIISYGSPSTSGYGVVGPRTASAIRLACSGGYSNNTASTGSGSGTGSGVVSGFLQVSPISGAAPLTTTATVTVNTAASCGGGTYTLDYGDGTQPQVITLQPGICSQQNQVFQHTYQNGGTYTLTLSAGSHSSTATVTVSGSSAAQGSPTQASGSINALVTSGTAPFSTTFYISCASGLAYDVVYGDGSDLGSNGVSQSNCGGSLQSVAHTYKSPGTYNAQLIIFVRNSQGTISSQAVATQGITVGSASASSGSSNSNTYSAPTLSPNVNGNPLAASLQFQIGPCASYSINWGDGASSPGTGPCGGTSNTTQTTTHTYASAGTYSVVLTRGSQTNTVGVTITQ
ncbi:MAG: hypothetical protein P4L81_07380 [Candidatus Pacebacteria bacterium]|nr:hypothetical protein [Candidatus Paceibacterota bacterium]